MVPGREAAYRELEEAYALNPGPWREHSIHVAEAAEKIAAACGLDPGRAFVFGLLHDIGRRTGVAHMRHIIDGYDFCMAKGWNEVARICLTHSFPFNDIRATVGKIDVTPEQYTFLRESLEAAEYDDYDKLIVLCDALADAKGFCILEKRFVDVTRRYGIAPFTIERWNAFISIKEYFDSCAGMSVYRLLPGIEECVYT